MQISSISSRNFGLSYNRKMSDILRKGRANIDNIDDFKLWNEAKTGMDNLFPDTWKLSVNKKNNLVLSDSKNKPYKLRPIGPDIPDAMVLFLLFCDLKELNEQIEVKKINGEKVKFQYPVPLDY